VWPQKHFHVAQQERYPPEQRLEGGQKKFLILRRLKWLEIRFLFVQASSYFTRE
jgi:hypothetical protein